jgi:hypothetical protein
VNLKEAWCLRLPSRSQSVNVIPRQSAPGGNVTRTSRHVWSRFRDDSHGNHTEFTEILMNIQQRRLGRRNGSLAGCRVPVSGPGGDRAQVQDSLQMKNSSRSEFQTQDRGIRPNLANDLNVTARHGRVWKSIGRTGADNARSGQDRDLDGVF